MRSPPGGAHDDIDAERSETRHIGGHRRWCGKLHGHIDAAKTLRGNTLRFGVVVDIEPQRNVKTILGRQRLHEAPHFSVSYDGQIHICRHHSILCFLSCPAISSGGTISRRPPGRAAGRILHAIVLRTSRDLLPRRRNPGSRATPPAKSCECSRLERSKRAGGNAGRMPDIIAHHAYDGLVVFHAHLGKFAQPFADFRQGARNYRWSVRRLPRSSRAYPRPSRRG